MDGDCGRELEIVKARGAALIRERMLSERSEFFLSRIAFSRITGLLLSLMPCNRNRKHPIPACPDNVDQHIVSDRFSDVSCFIAKYLADKHEFSLILQIFIDTFRACFSGSHRKDYRSCSCHGISAGEYAFF